MESAVIIKFSPFVVPSPKRINIGLFLKRGGHTPGLSIIVISMDVVEVVGGVISISLGLTTFSLGVKFRIQELLIDVFLSKAFIDIICRFPCRLGQ